MRNRTGFLWGIFLIVLSVAFIGDALGIWYFRLFFDGWWTLFLIVPSVIMLITRGYSEISAFFLLFGVLMLLREQRVIYVRNFFFMVGPIILLLVGIHLIFPRAGRRGFGMSVGGSNHIDGGVYSVFGAQTRDYTNIPLEDMEVNAVFGSVKLNLRNAIIEKNVTINCSSVFGGIEIFLPQDVRIMTSGTPVFGGISNKALYSNAPEAKIVCVNADCVFGGVDIKN